MEMPDTTSDQLPPVSHIGGYATHGCIESLLSTLEGARELFFEKAADNEQAGKLADESFNRLLECGGIHAITARELGGSGLGAIAELRRVETLAAIDATTAWVAMATGFCTAAAAAYLPDNAANKIFAPDQRGVIAGAGAPTGIARTVPGGFRVSGHWRYGSGILHADWAHCGAIVEVDGQKELDADGAPVIRMCYIPIDQVSLLGNWDVIGLRGTGSVDFAVDDVFVPIDFTVLAASPQHRRGCSIFGQSFTLATYIGHTGWAIGASRRILDELATFAASQGQRPASLGGNQGFQEHYAQHEAELFAVRAFAHAIWEEAEQRSDEGEKLDVRTVTLIRLALVHATDVAAHIATFAFRIAGGESLRQGTLQRLCRDVQAGCQHMTSAPTVKQACGRVLAGLADGEEWSANGLVKRAR